MGPKQVLSVVDVTLFALLPFHVCVWCLLSLNRWVGLIPDLFSKSRGKLCGSPNKTPIHYRHFQSWTRSPFPLWFNFFFSTDDLWNKTYSIPSPLGSCSDRRRRIDSMESFVTYVLNKGRYISSLHHFEWMEKTKAVDYLSNHSLGNQVDNERDWHLVKIVEWQFGFLS